MPRVTKRSRLAARATPKSSRASSAKHWWLSFSPCSRHPRRPRRARRPQHCPRRRSGRSRRPRRKIGCGNEFCARSLRRGLASRPAPRAETWSSWASDDAGGARGQALMRAGGAEPHLGGARSARHVATAAAAAAAEASYRLCASPLARVLGLDFFSLASLARVLRLASFGSRPFARALWLRVFWLEFSGSRPLARVLWLALFGSHPLVCFFLWLASFGSRLLASHPLARVLWLASFGLRPLAHVLW
jgi:hypothetical protein